MNAGEGMIVPAGSTLAQFEIQRYADGHVDDFLPCIVWVDVGAALKPFKAGIGCNCNGPFYPIRQFPDGITATTPFVGYTLSACKCMGRFLE